MQRIDLRGSFQLRDAHMPRMCPVLCYESGFWGCAQNCAEEREVRVVGWCGVVVENRQKRIQEKPPNAPRKTYQLMRLSFCWPVRCRATLRCIELGRRFTEPIGYIIRKGSAKSSTITQSWTSNGRRVHSARFPRPERLCSRSDRRSVPPGAKRSQTRNPSA